MGTRFMAAFLAMVLCLFMFMDSNVEAYSSEEYLTQVYENFAAVDEPYVEGLQVLNFERVINEQGFYDVGEFYKEFARLQKEGNYKGKYIVFPEFCFSKNFYGEMAVLLMNPENWECSDNNNPVQKVEMLFEPIDGVDYVLFKLL